MFVRVTVVIYLFIKCLVDSDVPEHYNSLVKKNLNNGGLRVWIMYMSTHIIAICEQFCQVSMGLIVQAKLTGQCNSCYERNTLTMVDREYGC